MSATLKKKKNHRRDSIPLPSYEVRNYEHVIYMSCGKKINIYTGC